MPAAIVRLYKTSPSTEVAFYQVNYRLLAPHAMNMQLSIPGHQDAMLPVIVSFVEKQYSDVTPLVTPQDAAVQSQFIGTMMRDLAGHASATDLPDTTVIADTMDTM